MIWSNAIHLAEPCVLHLKIGISHTCQDCSHDLVRGTLCEDTWAVGLGLATLDTSWICLCIITMPLKMTPNLSFSFNQYTTKYLQYIEAKYVENGHVFFLNGPEYHPNWRGPWNLGGQMHAESLGQKRCPGGASLRVRREGLCPPIRDKTEASPSLVWVRGSVTERINPSRGRIN